LDVSHILGIKLDDLRSWIKGKQPPWL